MSLPAPAGPDASEGSAPKRRRISIPSDANVGCAKCYHNKELAEPFFNAVAVLDTLERHWYETVAASFSRDPLDPNVFPSFLAMALLPCLDVDEASVIEIKSCDQVDVSELFSRPRLVPRCQFFDLIPGESFDMKDDEELDLGAVNGRASVWKHIDLYDPRVFLLSPPCTLFSQLMKLWGRQAIGEEKYLTRLLTAKQLWEFACDIAKSQLGRGQYFVLEHPDGASSWEEDSAISLMQQDGVMVSRFDQCRFGLKAPVSRKPIRKRTKLLHNIPALHITFGDVFCQCQEEHRRIEGCEAGVPVSSFCETYPPEMVQGLLTSIRTEIGVEMVD
eukprot:s571_g8.t1